MRELKHHEKKLLKKLDLYKYKKNKTIVKNNEKNYNLDHENNIINRYYITNREEYIKYNRIVGMIKKLANKILNLKNNELKYKLTQNLINKLYEMGFISTPTNKTLKVLLHIKVTSILKRRIIYLLLKLNMCHSLKQATQYILQGHIRIGPDIIRDPSFIVTRKKEDFITWTNTSIIKKHIKKYNDELDDFDLLG